MDIFFTYEKANGEIIITGLKGDVTDSCIVIPEAINDMPVTQISKTAFWGKTIADIKIGKNIKKVGLSAFTYCKNLKSVVWNAPCEIPYGCFAGCLRIADFDIKKTKAIGQIAFEGSGLQKICLPANVEKISDSAFKNCEQLEKVDWNCKCNEIPEHCFENCGMLGQFDFSKIKNIEKRAFQKSGLQKLYLSENITYVSEYAFAECKNLKKVVWDCKCDEIPAGCFRKCSELSQFEFSNLKKLGDDAFKHSGLTSVTLNKGVEVGKRCFAYCDKLKKVEWLSDHSIVDKVFENCKNLEEVIISDKVKNISHDAFRGCPNVEFTFV